MFDLKAFPQLPIKIAKKKKNYQVRYLKDDAAHIYKHDRSTQW